jgi:hypothetical protein
LTKPESTHTKRSIKSRQNISFWLLAHKKGFMLTESKWLTQLLDYGRSSERRRPWRICLVPEQRDVPSSRIFPRKVDTAIGQLRAADPVPCCGRGVEEGPHERDLHRIDGRSFADGENVKSEELQKGKRKGNRTWVCVLGTGKGVENTDGGYADALVLEGQIKAYVMRQEAQDLPRILEADFSTTDAFKVPKEKEAAAGRQNHEIATVPGHVRYQEKSRNMVWVARTERGMARTC